MKEDIDIQFKNYRENIFQCQPLTKDQSRVLVLLLSNVSMNAGDLSKNKEREEQEVALKKAIEEDFVSSIITMRIKALKLPIVFTLEALFYVSVMAENNPGRGVTILIDALTEYENQTVTLNDIVKLYPNGFYRKDIFKEYVEGYLKPRKVKWAEIY